MRRSTPLQWAIQHNNLDVVRTLLQWDADPHHVSALGWNPLFYCWPRLRATWDDKSEILKLLAEHSVLDLEMVDANKWTALHRASAFGTAADVMVLISLGANPLSTSYHLGWQAIHYSVTAGNEQTFFELVKYYGDNAFRMVDKRGWTLLHIAASKGCSAIIRNLLEGGSDPDRLSRPFFSYMDKSLFGRKLTAEEIVKAHSFDSHQLYLELLSELGITLRTHVEVEELSDEDGDYWDAEE
jgi:ankyrin repeat protein